MLLPCGCALTIHSVLYLHCTPACPQIMQPDLDEVVQQQGVPVVSSIYDKHKATLGDTLG